MAYLAESDSSGEANSSAQVAAHDDLIDSRDSAFSQASGHHRLPNEIVEYCLKCQTFSVPRQSRGFSHYNNDALLKARKQGQENQLKCSWSMSEREDQARAQLAAVC